MATVDDLLGRTKRQTRIPSKWREYYDKLVQTRESLLRQDEGLAKDSEPVKAATGLHMADAGSDSFNQDLAFGILSSDREILYQIDEAIARIRNGTYGRCEMTGKPISAKRLEAVPWTRFSAEAERQLEAAGVDRRARLPQRGNTTLPQDLESGEEIENE